MWTILPHESLLNLSASKASQHSTEFRMNPYWICEHLKLIKIEHKSFLEKVEIFPHESLPNLWASKASQNSTEFLNEMCKQFAAWILTMNPQLIRIQLIRILTKTLTRSDEKFCKNNSANTDSTNTDILFNPIKSYERKIFTYSTHNNIHREISIHSEYRVK